MTRQLTRAATLHNAVTGASQSAREQCAANLYWAFSVTPLYAETHEHRLRGMFDLISRTGIPERDVPAAVALALSRRNGETFDQALSFVDILGVDAILGALALPEANRGPFLLGLHACPCIYCKAMEGGDTEALIEARMAKMEQLVSKEG